ncbi:hypothetical protein ACP70R_004997 [Stipagrostis hirtigluma subsp. patula]
MALRTLLLLTLAVALLVAGELPVPAAGQEHPTGARRDEGPMPARHGGSAGAGSGAVEEEKAYIVGRPLFKVPPSNPCRAKAMGC